MAELVQECSAPPGISNYIATRLTPETEPETVSARKSGKNWEDPVVVMQLDALQFDWPRWLAGLIASWQSLQLRDVLPFPWSVPSIDVSRQVGIYLPNSSPRPQRCRGGLGLSHMIIRSVKYDRGTITV